MSAPAAETGSPPCFDEDEAPALMSEDPVAQEFFELARYNDAEGGDGGGALARVQQLVAEHPLLPAALDIATGRTALHMAASNGHVEIVRALLAAGARVDAASRESGYTALHDAVLTNKGEVAAVLLAAGASPATRNAQCAESALELAEKLGFEALAAALLKADTTVEQYETEGGKITMELDDSEMMQVEAGEGSATAPPAEGARAMVDAVGVNAPRTNLDVDDVE